jgi:hypothetical protein
MITRSSTNMIFSKPIPNELIRETGSPKNQPKPYFVDIDLESAIYKQPQMWAQNAAICLFWVSRQRLNPNGTRERTDNSSRKFIYACPKNYECVGSWILDRHTITPICEGMYKGMMLVFT